MRARQRLGSPLAVVLSRPCQTRENDLEGNHDRRSNDEEQGNREEGCVESDQNGLSCNGLSQQACGGLAGIRRRP